MAKIPIDYKDYFSFTMDMMVKYGLLLVSADSQGKANPMTIGWGTIGSIWTKPVFIVMVRPSRYSYELLEQTPEFSVNVPHDEHRKAVALCGSKSGRDIDKFAETGLTPVASDIISVPVIDQCPVNYECKIIHKVDMIAGGVPEEIQTTFYKSDDYHRVYFGEIVSASADENLLL